MCALNWMALCTVLQKCAMQLAGHVQNAQGCLAGMGGMQEYAI